MLSRLPGRLADIALEDAELVAEGKHLGAELGVGAGADEDKSPARAQSGQMIAPEFGTDLIEGELMPGIT